MLSPNILILGFFFLLSACGPARMTPNDHLINFNPVKYEDVLLFNITDTRDFGSIPLEGDARDGQRFWSGDYWPANRGSINYRWNAYTPNGRTIPSPDRSIVAQMTYEDLAQLSPAEKYDILLGRYDYPLTREVNEKANPNAQYWEGICNGWALASAFHKEPTPKDITNPEGIVVPFGSSDIKALVSYYYFHKVLPTNHIGRRCDKKPRILGRTPEECKDDVNPGSFHLALGNTIGLKKQSFLMDVKRYKEVWNQPVVSYRSRIIETDDDLRGNSVPPSAVKGVRIETKVFYVNESRKNTWYVINNTTEQKYDFLEYDYWLYLNERDEVIGGRWKSSERPDFIWRSHPTGGFDGVLERVAGLLND